MGTKISTAQVMTIRVHGIEAASQRVRAAEGIRLVGRSTGNMETRAVRIMPVMLRALQTKASGGISIEVSRKALSTRGKVHTHGWSIS